MQAETSCPGGAEGGAGSLRAEQAGQGAPLPSRQQTLCSDLGCLKLSCCAPGTRQAGCFVGCGAPARATSRCSMQAPLVAPQALSSVGVGPLHSFYRDRCQPLAEKLGPRRDIS